MDETEIVSEGKDWMVALIAVIMITIILSLMIEFKSVFFDANQKTIQKTNESILEEDD